MVKKRDYFDSVSVQILLNFPFLMARKMKWKTSSLTTAPPAKLLSKDPGVTVMSSRWWWSFLSVPDAESLTELKDKEFILQSSWCKPKIRPNCRNISTCQHFVMKTTWNPLTSVTSRCRQKLVLLRVLCALELAPRQNVPGARARAGSYWGTQGLPWWRHVLCLPPFT